MVKVRIWDWPTRLFHWGLVLAIVGMVVTGQTGQMMWHFRLGQAVLALAVSADLGFGGRPLVALCALCHCALGGAGLLAWPARGRPGP